MARAITSLPVPVSPVSNTVASVGATSATCARTGRNPPCLPTIVSRNEVGAWSGSSVSDVSERGNPPFIGGTGWYPLNGVKLAAALIISPSRFVGMTCSLHRSVVGICILGTFNRGVAALISRAGSPRNCLPRQPKRESHGLEHRKLVVVSQNPAPLKYRWRFHDFHLH